MGDNSDGVLDLTHSSGTDNNSTPLYETDSNPDMFSVHTTPGKPRVRQPQRSSPRIRDRRGSNVDVASLSPTSSPASGLNSPQTGGVASSASRRTSHRTPKRTSAPEDEGYETKYVKPVPQRFSRAAGGKDGGGGGSFGSPLLVSSSQGSGDSDEAEGESSPGTGGSSEGGGGKGKEPERRIAGPEVKKSGKGPRWWTQQGERELLWRLIPKHLASKHSAKKAKDEEWWKCAQALSKKVEMTIRVKEVQKDGNLELVTKKVTVDMGRKMEVGRRCGYYSCISDCGSIFIKLNSPNLGLA
ncbi:unnamed protein product [Ectocarpus sp. CCAP 1310/34]|nr:unnamed protein product [Ectocarpus sp. CCAP 1310/34]